MKTGIFGLKPATDSSAPHSLRQWLESQGIEQTTLSRLTGADPGGEKPLKISNMLQVARWMESPIETIEALAESNRSQLVLHLAGLEANS